MARVWRETNILVESTVEALRTALNRMRSLHGVEDDFRIEGLTWDTTNYVCVVSYLSTEGGRGF